MSPPRPLPVTVTRSLPCRLGVVCLALGIAASGACAGAGRPGTDATPGDSVYIGVAAGRTTQTFFRGATLALERLNKERPAGTRPFALRMPIDSQTTQVAVAAAFRDDPTVIGVVGHTGSQQTMEAAPIYSDVEHGGARALVAVTPTATNPMVTTISPWIFRVCPTDEDAAYALARFAADSMRVKRLAVIYRNDLFGRGFTRMVAPALEELGVTVVERDPYLAGITEWEAYVRRMARRNIDGLLVAGGGADAAQVIRALRRAGLHPQVLGTDDMASLNNDTASVAEFRGIRFSAFFDAARPVSPEAQAFITEYRERFGIVPNHQAALAYDAALLIGRATIAAGVDRTRVRDWIASLGDEGLAPVQGVTGPLSFRRGGDAVEKPIVIARVE